MRRFIGSAFGGLADGLRTSGAVVARVGLALTLVGSVLAIAPAASIAAPAPPAPPATPSTGPTGSAAAEVHSATGEHGFQPLTPVRVLDTRTDIGGASGALGPGSVVELALAGSNGVPAVGVEAVVLNVTSTRADSASFITVWPTGETRPKTSNLNTEPGQNTPNLVIAKVGVGGNVSMFNSAGTGHLVADLLGWFPDDGSFVGVNPVRALDTRDGIGAAAGAVGPASTTTLRIGGENGIPAAGVGSVVLNVTSVRASAASFITVWPADESRPTTSNLNTEPGQNTPNLVIVKLSGDGDVSLYNDVGTGHLIADVVGYFPTTAEYVGLNPARMMDTRDGTGVDEGAIGPDGTVTLRVTGAHGVPADDVAAVVLNVTSTRADAPSFVTVWPTGDTRPTASNLNTEPGQNTPNLVVAKVGANGDVSFYNSAGTGHLVADVLGYFPATGPTGAFFVVPDTTKTFAPESVMAVTPGAGGTNTLVLAAGQVAPAVGGHVVLGVTDATPDGLLGEVSSSTTNPDGTVKIVTRSATLSDAIPKGSMNLELAEFDRLELNENRNGLRAADSKFILDLGFAGCDVLAKAAGGGACPNEESENDSAVKTPPCAVEGSFEAGIDLSFGVEVKSAWEPGEQPFFSAAIVLGARGYASLQELILECEWSTEFASFKIQFFAGPIPVVITLDVGGTVELSAGIRRLGLSAEASATVKFGAQYKDGKISPVTEVTTTRKLDLDLDWTEVEVFAEIWTHLDLTIKLYNFIGFELSFGPFVDFRASRSNNPWWTIDLGFRGEISFILESIFGVVDESLVQFEIPLPSVLNPVASPDNPRGPKTRIRLAGAPGRFEQPTIATPRFPEAIEGLAFSTTFTAQPALLGPYTWRVRVPGLPGGLSLDSAGKLSGTPTGRGNYSFSLIATSPTGLASSERSFTIVVGRLGVSSPASFDPLVIDGPAQSVEIVPNGVGPFTYEILETFTPLGFSPPSFSVDPTRNVVSAVVTNPFERPHTGSVTIAVTDSRGAAAAPFTIAYSTVHGPPIIESVTVPSAAVGRYFGLQLRSSQGLYPNKWSVVSGTVPDGLDLGQFEGFGFISGTPTTAGEFTFVVRATDDRGVSGADVPITIVVAPPFVVVVPDIPTMSIGDPNTTIELAATGGSAPYSFILGDVDYFNRFGNRREPPPIFIVGSTLTIRPIQQFLEPGSGTVSILAQEIGGRVSAAVVVPITLQWPPATVLTTSLDGGQVLYDYSAQLTADAEAPFTWSVASGALPGGISLSADGALTGVPTSSGATTFTVLVTAAHGQTAESGDLTIDVGFGPAPVVTTTGLINGVSGRNYSDQLEAQGLAPFTWSIESGSLPDGIAFLSDGQLTGVPTEAASATFTALVTSADGQSAESPELTIHIASTASTSRVSNAVGGAAGNAASSRAEANDNGRWVVFTSSATDLVDSVDTNGSSDVFLRDTASDTTTLLSQTPAGAAGNAFSSSASISADGSLVVFATTATDLSPDGAGVYAWDLDLPGTGLRHLSDLFAGSSVSRDGATVFTGSETQLHSIDANSGVTDESVITSAMIRSALGLGDTDAADWQVSVPRPFGDDVVLVNLSYTTSGGSPDASRLVTYDFAIDELTPLADTPAEDVSEFNVSSNAGWAIVKTSSSCVVDEVDVGHTVYQWRADLGARKVGCSDGVGVAVSNDGATSWVDEQERVVVLFGGFVPDPIAPIGAHPSFSDDDGVIVFQSTLPLAADDDNDVSDVFLYRRDPPPVGS